MLWDNKFITIQQKPISWPQWQESGILFVNDLLHLTLPRFLSHEELSHKFGIRVSFLELLQIRSAIPCSWKRKIVPQAHQDPTIKPHFYSSKGILTTIIGKSSKFIYYLLVHFLKPMVTSQVKWNEVFPVNTQEHPEYWETIYKTPYKAVRDTKLQAFHFRVVHRFVPCNKFLKNIRITRDDTCSFCPSQDTIEHFLFACPVVVSFWKKVVDWLDREADININVSKRAFPFGIPENTPQAKVINFLLLFAKFFVYRQKLFHQGDLNFIHFLQDLRKRLQVEKYINTIENKQGHFRKWARIYAALGWFTRL